MDPINFTGIKDIHLRDQNPRSRIDDYKEEVFNKLDQVGALARHFKCQAILNAGDLYHFKAPTKTSHRLSNRVQRKFKTEYPCDVVGILGNHDEQYDDFASLDKQPIGSLIESGAMWLLDNNPYVVERDGLKVVIKGTSWDRDKNIENLIKHKKEDADVLIVVVHALLDPDGTNFYGHKCAGYQEVSSQIEADVVFCGHLHVDHGIKEVGGKYFINTGAISRGSLHEDNVVRVVNTFLLSIDRDERGKPRISFKDIKLKTEPADQIFDLVRHKAEKEENKLMEQFVNELTSQSLAVDRHDLASSIRSLEGFDDKVRQRALRYLAAVSAEDQAGRS